MKPRTTTWHQTSKTKLHEIETWSSNGLLEKEMAERLGFRPSTFSEWKAVHAELTEAIKRGRDRFISSGMDALEVAAITRATGYMATEAETILEDGPQGQITRTKTTLRHIPADPTLTIWLLSTCFMSRAFPGNERDDFPESSREFPGFGRPYGLVTFVS